MGLDNLRLYVQYESIFGADPTSVLQKYLDDDKITVGWDYEYIAMCKTQDILESLAKELIEEGCKFHTTVNSKRRWRGGRFDMNY